MCSERMSLVLSSLPDGRKHQLAKKTEALVGKYNKTITLC